MTNEIMNTSDLLDDGADESYVRENMSATEQPDPKADLEFHVQMKSWTLRDMQSLIVEAAAFQIVGRMDRPTALTKEIEARVKEILVEKANARLSEVTAEIIDQPVTPSYGDKKPVTMREMIGLYGREYLTQVVDQAGNPTTDYYSNKKTRMLWLTERAMDAKFKREIEAATSAAISAAQAEIRALHAQFIEKEKARLRAALAKEVAPK